MIFKGSRAHCHLGVRTGGRKKMWQSVGYPHSLSGPSRRGRKGKLFFGFGPGQPGFIGSYSTKLPRGWSPWFAITVQNPAASLGRFVPPSVSLLPLTSLACREPLPTLKSLLILAIPAYRFIRSKR